MSTSIEPDKADMWPRLPRTPLTPGTLSEERIAAFACESDKRVFEAAPGMRAASQKLYDALQRYLAVPDSELPADLIEGMNELESAWHKADGTLPEDANGQAA